MDNTSPACWPGSTFNNAESSAASRACQLSPPIQPNSQAEITKQFEHLLNDAFLALRTHSGTTGNFFRLEFKDLALRHTFALLRLRSLPYEGELMEVPSIAHGLAQSFLGRYGPDIWFGPETNGEDVNMLCQKGDDGTVWDIHRESRRRAVELESYFMILLQLRAVAPKDWLLEKIASGASACDKQYASLLGHGAMLDCFSSALPMNDAPFWTSPTVDTSSNAAAELTDGMRKMSLDNSRLIDETMTCNDGDGRTSSRTETACSVAADYDAASQVPRCGEVANGNVDSSRSGKVVQGAWGRREGDARCR